MFQKAASVPCPKWIARSPQPTNCTQPTAYQLHAAHSLPTARSRQPTNCTQPTAYQLHAAHSLPTALSPQPTNCTQPTAYQLHAAHSLPTALSPQPTNTISQTISNNFLPLARRSFRKPLPAVSVTVLIAFLIASHHPTCPIHLFAFDDTNAPCLAPLTTKLLIASFSSTFC